MIFGDGGCKGRLLLAGAAAVALLLAAMAETGVCAERIFVGKVVRYDVPSRILSVKGSGTVVTFDASTVTLSGYRSTEDIRKGDTVGVVYTSTGVKIIRSPSIKAASAPAPGTATGSAPQEKASQVAPSPPEKKGSTMTRRLQRRPENGNGRGFEDCDVNKDGKLTPVELSVVLPDITMAQFREYDTDRNGCLDPSEFAKTTSRPRQQNTDGPTK